MKHQFQILSAVEIDRILKRITLEILEARKGTQNMALIGIHTRGVFIAKRIQAHILNIEGQQIPTGSIDIALYRDDWTQIGHQPVVQATNIPFSVDNQEIILVDDVLFTGRTIRAAMDALIDFGRPAMIELAVLIDRGHRELPIQSNYTGKYAETRHSETVNVMLSECDQKDSVMIQQEKNNGHKNTQG